MTGIIKYQYTEEYNLITLDVSYTLDNILNMMMLYYM